MGLGDERRPGNEPTPLVHNGIMYLVNTENIVQALDARTGELIWENRVGPNALIGQAAMRNMAIYQDKVFVATTDARLVALDARTGKMVWDTPIADRAKGYANTGGPIVIKGKVVKGLGGCDRYGNDGCFISAYDAATGKQLWKFNTVAAARRAGRRHLGQARRQPARRRRDLDHRQLRSRSRPHLLGRRAGQAVDAREPRHDRTSTTCCTRARRVALRPKDGKLAWYYQHAPGESLDLDEVFERVLVDIGDQKVVFTIGKAGILWKLDRGPASSSATRKRSSRTCSTRSIRRPARRTIAPTSSSSRPASGSRRARAPKAATTGRR